MDPVWTLGRDLGIAGIGLLAVILSLRLGIGALALLRQQRRVNGTNTFSLEQLRLVCPLAAASRSLDDLFEVLVAIREQVTRLADAQRDMVKSNESVCATLVELRLELRDRSR